MSMLCTFCIDQQRQGSNELRRFDTSVSRRFVQTCFCYYYELWLWKIRHSVCMCVRVELMSYRQHSSISSHNRKCAIRRHFEIYVRCGLHSIPSIACMSCIYCILNIVYERASERLLCMEICYLWPHLSDQHISTAWQTPPFSTQRDEKQPHLAYETDFIVYICSMCSLAVAMDEIKEWKKKREKDWFSWLSRREHTVDTEVKMKCVYKWKK